MSGKNRKLSRKYSHHLPLHCSGQHPRVVWRTRSGSTSGSPSRPTCTTSPGPGWRGSRSAACWVGSATSAGLSAARSSRWGTTRGSHDLSVERILLSRNGKWRTESTGRWSSGPSIRRRVSSVTFGSSTTPDTREMSTPCSQPSASFTCKLLRQKYITHQTASLLLQLPRRVLSRSEEKRQTLTGWTWGGEGGAS